MNNQPLSNLGDSFRFLCTIGLMWVRYGSFPQCDCPGRKVCCPLAQKWTQLRRDLGSNVKLQSPSALVGSPWPSPLTSRGGGSVSSYDKWGSWCLHLRVVCEMKCVHALCGSWYIAALNLYSFLSAAGRTQSHFEKDETGRHRCLLVLSPWGLAGTRSERCCPGIISTFHKKIVLLAFFFFSP